MAEQGSLLGSAQASSSAGAQRWWMLPPRAKACSWRPCPGFRDGTGRTGDQEPFSDVEVRPPAIPAWAGRWSSAAADSGEARNCVLTAQHWWSARDGCHCWVPPAPPSVETRGLGRMANLGRLFCSPGSLARQVTVPLVCRSSSFPSCETTVQALHPAPGRDSPLFLLFLSPKLRRGSMWAGSVVPPSAKPTGGWRDNSRFLPSPSLPRAVAGGGSSIVRWQSTAGKGGTEVPSLCPPWTGKEGGIISDRKNLPSSFTSH